MSNQRLLISTDVLKNTGSNNCLCPASSRVLKTKLSDKRCSGNRRATSFRLVHVRVDLHISVWSAFDEWTYCLCVMMHWNCQGFSRLRPWETTSFPSRWAALAFVHQPLSKCWHCTKCALSHRRSAMKAQSFILVLSSSLSMKRKPFPVWKLFFDESVSIAHAEIFKTVSSWPIVERSAGTPDDSLGSTRPAKKVHVGCRDLYTIAAHVPFFLRPACCRANHNETPPTVSSSRRQVPWMRKITDTRFGGGVFGCTQSVISFISCDREPCQNKWSLFVEKTFGFEQTKSSHPDKTSSAQEAIIVRVLLQATICSKRWSENRTTCMCGSPDLNRFLHLLHLPFVERFRRGNVLNMCVTMVTMCWNFSSIFPMETPGNHIISGSFSHFGAFASNLARYAGTKCLAFSSPLRTLKAEAEPFCLTSSSLSTTSVVS